MVYDVALKPDKTGINLRLLSKEKEIPIRKNPLVMCFEGAFIFLAISRGKFNYLLVNTLHDFLQIYKEFDSLVSLEERHQRCRVKEDDRERFFKALSATELDLLFRTYKIMCAAVEMTNNKAFKCCELSVRLIEGESGQGFKPGGDSGPRILHRLHLHNQLIERRKLASAPSFIQLVNLKKTNVLPSLSSDGSAALSHRSSALNTVAVLSPRSNSSNVVPHMAQQSYDRAKASVTLDTAGDILKSKGLGACDYSEAERDLKKYSSSLDQLAQLATESLQSETPYFDAKQLFPVKKTVLGNSGPKKRKLSLPTDCDILIKETEIVKLLDREDIKPTTNFFEYTQLLSRLTTEANVNKSTLEVDLGPDSEEEVFASQHDASQQDSQPLSQESIKSNLSEYGYNF